MTLSLVIPFYNEEEVAEKVTLDLINEFNKNGVDLELVLVNNGSIDKTHEILSRLAQDNSVIKVVTVPVNEGFGWGILCGFKEAKGEYLGYTAGDGQTLAKDTVIIYKKLALDKLDLCKASRMNRRGGHGLLRQIVSEAYNLICRLFFVVQTKDINSSPKILRREAFRMLNLSCKDWFLDAEIMIKAHRLDFKVGEVLVVSQSRKGGRSKVKLSTMFEFVKNIFKYRIFGF